MGGWRMRYAALNCILTTDKRHTTSSTQKLMSWFASNPHLLGPCLLQVLGSLPDLLDSNFKV